MYIYICKYIYNIWILTKHDIGIFLFCVFKTAFLAVFKCQEIKFYNKVKRRKEYKKNMEEKKLSFSFSLS